MTYIFKSTSVADVEELASQLHEAGRAAVESGQTVAADHHGEKTRKFIEWEEITENAREGRRVQARFLLGAYSISITGDEAERRLLQEPPRTWPVWAWVLAEMKKRGWCCLDLQRESGLTKE